MSKKQFKSKKCSKYVVKPEKELSLLKEFKSTINLHNNVIGHIWKTATQMKKTRISPVTITHFVINTGIQEHLAEFCRNCPKAEISGQLEKLILGRVGFKELQYKFSSLINKMLDENREEYLKIIQRTSNACKLKSVAIIPTKIEPYRNLGKTENYHKFLENRKKIEKKYLLHSSLIKQILHQCVTELPYELFNLNMILEDQSLEFCDFKNKLENIKNNGLQNLQDFYESILTIVKKSRTLITEHCLGACTGLLSVHISRMLAHTFLHVVDFTNSKKHYLILNVYFKDKLLLHPMPQDLVYVYQDFLEKILLSIQTFPILEKHKFKRSRKHIHLCLTKEFFHHCINTISKNINNQYSAIFNYLSELEATFIDIYQDIISQGHIIVEYDLIFETGCEKISYYRSFVGKISHIPDNYFFPIGQLNLIKYREIFKEILLTTINNVFNKLSAQHEWENNDICETFEMIYIRATKTPITTEELIEIGKFMASVKDEYFSILQERIIVTMQYLLKLIQLGPLTETHMRVNAKAFNWINKIVPIIEKNSSTYESLKFEAEEKLQQAIESINVEVAEVYPLLTLLDSMDEISRVNEYLNYIVLHMEKIKEIESKIQWINQEEIALSFPKSLYSEFDELKTYVYPFYHLLKLCQDVQRKLSVWLDGQFDLINYHKTKAKVENFREELLNIQKTYRSKLRQAQDENLLIRFRGTVDDPDMLNWPAPLKLCFKAIKLIQDFEPSLTVIKIMCNEALMARHWNKMSKVAGFDIIPNAGTRLRKIIEIDMKDNMEKFELISITATKEKELHENLKKMKKNWKEINFSVIMDEQMEIYLFIQLDNIQNVIDDHLIKLINMRSSVYVKPYIKEVKVFYDQLLKIDNAIKQCVEVQNDLLQFIPLFHTLKDINNENIKYELFQDVLNNYEQCTSEIRVISNVLITVNKNNLMKKLIYCKETLQIIQKGISEHFENLCISYPRLYFLSYREMIIVSSHKNPNNISNILNNLFLGTMSFKLKVNLDILGVIGQNEEAIEFQTAVKTENCSIEKWLKAVENQIIVSLKLSLHKSLLNYNQAHLDKWVTRWPSQVLLAVSQINFTSNTHKSLTENTLITHFEEVMKYIDNITHLLCNQEVFNDYNKQKIKSLIILTLYNRDVIQRLIDKNIQTTKDFEWIHLLRHYFIENICVINILETAINYGYEFLGVFHQIPITPTTERCYNNIIAAYQNRFHGLYLQQSCEDQTETVTSLCHALAVHCAIFSCSPATSFDVISNFLKGVMLCGCWSIVKNFDSNKPAVISLCAQQIFNKCFYEGNNFSSFEIKNNIGRYFICFNVQNISSLPKNLRYMLRPFVITIPDSKAVCEIILLSYGIKKYRTLSEKLNVCIQLFQSTFIFKESDSDIHIMNQILKNVGENFDRNKTEEQILYQSIIKVITPKVSNKEIQLLYQILSDLFPKQKMYGTSTNLKEKVQLICEKLNLIIRTPIYAKVEEIAEALNLENGCIITGMAFTGKSVALKILKEYFFLSNINIIVNYFNPITISIEQLYGFYLSKFKWIDGIITKLLRDCNKLPIWNIFDGSVNISWMEYFNTIAQKQKICLTSGEVLMCENVKYIFETTDLHEITPTLVSLYRMIYIDTDITDWNMIIQSWLNNDFEWCKGQGPLIEALFNWIIPPLLEFLIENRSELLYQANEISLVKTTLRLFEMLNNDAYKNSTRKVEDFKNISSWIQASFMQSIVLSFSSILTVNFKLKFDEFFKQLWKNQNDCYPYPKSIEKIEVNAPQDGFITDYFYTYQLKGNWKLWSDILKHQKMEVPTFLFDYFIPTADTLRYTALINMFIAYNYPVLVVGSENIGKTFLINDILNNKINKKKFASNTITLSRTTIISQLQLTVLSGLNKNRLNHYDPPNKKASILFIDDLHIVTDNSATELFRQFFDYGTWYIDTNLIYLHNVNIISCMNLNNNCLRKLCQRFLRHFSILSFIELSEENLTKIYSTILLDVWKKIGFGNDISTVVNQIVNATYHIYQTALLNFKPTLQKPLHKFGLNNFAKVIQASCFIKKESIDADKKLYYKLWTHEILRVFGDRLNHDKNHLLYDAINFCFNKIFNEEFNVLLENLEISGSKLSHYTNLEKILCGSYDNSERNYFEPVTKEQLLELSLTAIAQYNAINLDKFDIILFENALIQLSKICRVLTLPSSNLLQIGIAGSGRETLVKLACFIYKQEFFKPRLIPQYNHSCWIFDIKKVLNEAGGAGKSCTFLIRDSIISNELFFADIDLLLRTSKLPNIYTVDEKEELLNLVRIQMHKNRNTNLDVSEDSVFLYHQKLCKQNLHIILCLSPLTINFWKIFHDYPSIIKYCDVIYFDNWSSDAYENIAEIWTRNLKIDGEIKNQLLPAFSYFHNSISNKSVNFPITNGSFLTFLKIFYSLMKSKQNEITSIKKTYLGALKKLSHAASQILQMQKSLAEYQPQLEAMTLKAFQMTKQIEAETVEVEKASNLVKHDEEIADQQAAAAQILKLDCEADLAQAIPILEDAISALNTLKPTDITLVKSMKNPPDAIKLVMAAVCVIKDVKPDRIPDPATGRKTIDYWGPSKRILGDMNFLQTLKDFDKDNIKPEIMVKIRKDYLPHKDFKPHTVAKASSAAEGLCKWIIAMDMYDKVAKEVAPKKEKLEKAENEYETTMAILNEKKEQVARIEQRLADLNALLHEAMRKQQKLQKKVDLCKRKLNRAQKLIGGLSEEKIRWTNAVEQLKEQYNILPSNILLSSAIIAYFGPFSKRKREGIFKIWIHYLRSINLFDDNYCFHKIFEKTFSINKWPLLHLPNDEFFTDNGIIMNVSRRWNLFIDPQKLANKWIRNIEKYNNLKVCNFLHGTYFSTIENCVKYGQPVLLENIENFNTILTYLFQKLDHFESDIKYIKLFGDIKLLHESFRMYITENLKSPNYSEEIYDRLTVINFKLTKAALEDQLLTTISEVEHSEICDVKEKLLREKIDKTCLLLSIEDNILKILCESEIDILEDEKALLLLDESKELFKNILKEQKKLAHQENDLEEIRSGYKKIACYATKLYFTLHQLSKLNHAYQFSLNWFENLYISFIHKAPRFRNLTQRIDSLVNTFTYEFYQAVACSVFKKDRKLMMFLIYINLITVQNKTETETMALLLTKLEPIIVKCRDSWPPQTFLDNLNNFPYWLQIFKNNANLFYKLYISENPENYGLPKELNDSLNKLLIIKILRPDRFNKAFENCMKRELSQLWIEPLAFNIEKFYQDSHILSPILFILSSETNLIKSLKNFAKTKHLERKLHFIAFEKTNFEYIIKLIRLGQSDGLWICLENCHISTSLLCQLEIELEKINYENTNENFRIWLTTNNASKFTISLLENSVKIIAESPDGCRQRLRDLYLKAPINCHEFYTGCSKNHGTFARLLYSLSLFHSLILERQYLQPYFSNCSFIFNESDFQITITHLQTIVNTYSDPIIELHYLIKYCNYGGQIMDEWSQLLIGTVLEDYLSYSLINNSSHLFNDIQEYGLPTRNDYKDYINYIEKLPEEDSTELFGIHPNFSKIKESEKSKTILHQIMKISNNLIAENLTNISKKIVVTANSIPSEIYHCNKITKSTNDNYIFNRIIDNEVTQYNFLIILIKCDLNDIHLALEEGYLITDILQNVLCSINKNNVPQRWLKYSWFLTIDNLSIYIKSLIKRINFIQQLLQNSHNSIQIGYLFQPKSYIVAQRFLYSIQNSTPFTNIHFTLKYNDDKCQDNISGLSLFGANWNLIENYLEELPAKILKIELPHINLIPTDNKVMNLEFYECPLFKTIHTCKDNFISSIFMLTKLSPKHWIKRGVVLCCLNCDSVFQ